MASIRKSLATLWDTADNEVPPPLHRANAKQGVDLEQVIIKINVSRSL